MTDWNHVTLHFIKRYFFGSQIGRTTCGNSTLDCAIELVIHNYPDNGNVFSLYRNLMLSFSSSSQKRQKKNDIGMLLYSCFTARI